MSKCPRRFGSLKQQSTEHFHERNSVRDGVLQKITCQPSGPKDWFLVGPHIYVGTAIYKNPRPNCSSHLDYDFVDLQTIPDNWLPRTNYRPVSPDSILANHPIWQGRSITAYTRWVTRKMKDPEQERTLQSALLPAGPPHVGSCFSIAFDDERVAVLLAGASASLPFDFFVKALRKSNFSTNISDMFPLLERCVDEIMARTLRLNCSTIHYAKVWSHTWPTDGMNDSFSKNDRRLSAWSNLGHLWKADSAIKTPYARRQALVELDALVSIALGISAKQLTNTYSTEFGTLKKNEDQTWYDRRGRYVFVPSRPRVGLERKQWEEIRGRQLDPLTYAGIAPLPDWAHDALGPYEPPFDRCDREADMRQAYAEFVRRGVGSDA